LVPVFAPSELFAHFIHREENKLFSIPCSLPRGKIASVILSLPRKIGTVSKLRISIVQYLNTAPLVWGFRYGRQRGKYDLSFTVPSLCAEALRTGAAEIAIIPAIEYQRIEGIVILPDMSVSAKQQVRSLLLVAKMPIADVKTIALDQSSRSTQALVRILCAQHWEISPKFSEIAPHAATMLQDADAALLIGDPALRLAIAIEGGMEPKKGVRVCKAADAGIGQAKTLHVYDVAEEWRTMTGLPAVLALWAARGDANGEVIDDFLSSLDYGLANIPAIGAQMAEELLLPAGTLISYLSENIDFSLEKEQKAGLKLFYEHAAALGLIPQAKPIKWASGMTELDKPKLKQAGR
jgi:chorismate dehydratase